MKIKTDKYEIELQQDETRAFLEFANSILHQKPEILAVLMTAAGSVINEIIMQKQKEELT